jgi:hypothetical protein
MPGQLSPVYDTVFTNTRPYLIATVTRPGWYTLCYENGDAGPEGEFHENSLTLADGAHGLYSLSGSTGRQHDSTGLCGPGFTRDKAMRERQISDSGGGAPSAANGGTSMALLDASTDDGSFSTSPLGDGGAEEDKSIYSRYYIGG